MTAAPTSARVVLITGAGGGLGQGLISEFAARGWQVAAASHRPAAQPETDAVWPLTLEVTNRAQVSATVEQILTRWGRLDALINNAGVTADGLLMQMDAADFSRVLDVNLKGAFLCAQAVIRPMMKQRDGHIINLASFAARSGAAGQCNYAAAKAGLIGLTTSLAKEVGSRNVRVNTILPGVLPTPMTAQLNEETLHAFSTANALGRLNEVAEVARFIVFLAEMKNVSGQLFQLDSRVAPWT